MRPRRTKSIPLLQSASSLGMDSGKVVDSMQKRSAMECLRKLEEFVVTLSHGKDLFNSTYGLLTYSFGNRRIADVFEAVLEFPEYQEKCKHIAKRLCSSAVSSLEPAVSKQRGTDEASFMEELRYFWELYQLRDVPSLLQPEDKSSFDGVVDRLHRRGIDRSTRNHLPAEFLRLVNSDDDNESGKELPYFLKNLSDHETVTSKASEEQSHRGGDSLKLFEQVLNDVLSGKLKFESAAKRMEEGHVGVNTLAATELFFSVLEKTSSYAADVTSTLFALFENFFGSLQDDMKCSLMKCFFERWLSDHKCLPSFENDVTNFGSGLTVCINGIGDHVEIQSGSEKFKTVREKLAWYLLVAPRVTVHRLLLQSLDNRQIVPGVLNIFRTFSPIFEVETCSEEGTSQATSLLFNCVTSIFDEEASRWSNVEQQDRLVYLLNSLCRRKKSAAKDKSSEDSSCPSVAPEPVILSATAVVKLFVLPHLMKRTHVLLMLKILHRLMQTLGAKETVFQWSLAMGESDSTNALQTPELILLILEFATEYESSNQQAAEICHSLLKAFGERLQGDNVIFENETTEFILFSLRRYSWWIRYAVCSWFSHSLSAPKQQLPAGLYKCLTLDQQEQCEQISVDFPFSTVECFFLSLFELALFDVDLALAFLKAGVAVYPRDEHLVEKIALSLVNCCERRPYRQRIASLAPFISELLRMFDPSQEVRLVESLCESTFHGLRLIQHLLLLAAAARLGYCKASSTTGSSQESSSEGPPSNRYSSVADDILQAFCELSKAHAEKEVVNLRRSKLPFPPEIKEDILPPPQVSTRRDERVYCQLSALFNVACSITRLTAQPPFALQVLINSLAELLLEVQNMRIGTFLDDLPADYYKGKTVYAVAQPEGAKKQPHVEASSGQGIKKEKVSGGGLINGNATLCAENELFGTIAAPSYARDSLATARQISGLNMRRNVEKRLVPQENGTNAPSAPTEPRDNSGKNGKKKRGAKRR